MKKFIFLIFTFMFLTSCSLLSSDETFKDSHDSFNTSLIKEKQNGSPVAIPPEGVPFSLVKYDSEVGPLSAYISKDPQDGEKHPIVIWVNGGWSNSISSNVWLYNSWDNNQTGAFFDNAGILTMYPSFRGGNDNPGYNESIYGEINDIYSAYEYAKSLPYVDENKIYLVGHSTGATKVLLASAYDNKFRAIFALGPVSKIQNHNKDEFTFDIKDKDETKLRSPIYWLKDIQTPTFVIEGENGNSFAINQFLEENENPKAHFYTLKGKDHFDYIAPVTNLIANKILDDTGATTNISFTTEELTDSVEQEEIILYPHLTTYTVDENAFSFDYPAYWEILPFDDVFEGVPYKGIDILDTNEYYEEDLSFWSLSGITVFIEDLPNNYYDGFNEEYLGSIGTENLRTYELDGYTVTDGMLQDEESNSYHLVFSKNNKLYTFIFLSYAEDMDSTSILLEKIYESISLK